MVAGNRRLRRKRRKRERARKLEGVERGAGASARASAKKLLAESDELEAALRGWLRDAPGAGPSDDAFVENPFHKKPGFGGSGERCGASARTRAGFWPDGHADDDALSIMLYASIAACNLAVSPINALMPLGRASRREVRVRRRGEIRVHGQPEARLVVDELGVGAGPQPPGSALVFRGTGSSRCREEFQ